MVATNSLNYSHLGVFVFLFISWIYVNFELVFTIISLSCYVSCIQYNSLYNILFNKILCQSFSISLFITFHIFFLFFFFITCKICCTDYCSSNIFLNLSTIVYGPVKKWIYINHERIDSTSNKFSSRNFVPCKIAVKDTLDKAMLGLFMVWYYKLA